MSASILALVIILVSWCRSLAAEKTLPELKAVYEQEAERIASRLRSARATALEKYETGLTAAKKKLKAAGDLDGTVAAIGEIKRFTEEQTVPGTPPVKWPALLIAAHQRYTAACTAADHEQKKQHVSLIERYLRPLVQLKIKLVQKEKIDAALAVEDEIGRVQFIMADIQTHTLPGKPKKGPAYPAVDGLVLHYSFNDGADPAADDSGNDHDGKSRNTTWLESGQRGGACSFNGRDACIEILDADDGLGAVFQRDFGIACWVRTSSLRGRMTIIGVEGTSRYVRDGFEGFTLELHDGVPHIYIASGDTTRDILAAQSRLAENRWTHIAVSRARDTLTFFIDGKVDARRNVGAHDIKFKSSYPGYDSVGVSHDSYIGKSFPFNGALDELILVNDPFTAADVKRLQHGNK
jgi:hypothetical protein